MQHTKPYWSSEEVAERITMIEELLEREQALEDKRAGISNEILQLLSLVDATAEALDPEKLEPIIAEYYQTKNLHAKCAGEIYLVNTALEEIAAKASLVMNANDYRFLLSHHRAEDIIACLPSYPTGSLFQITHYFRLESLVFHATTYWDRTGIQYFFEGEQDQGALMVTLVGLPKYLLDWLSKEFLPEDSIVGEFQKCETPKFIASFMEANRMPPEKLKGESIEY